MNPLIEMIKGECVPKQGADGLAYLSLSSDGVTAIAGLSGRLPRDVEVEALKWGAVPERYLRNMGTIGAHGQIRLLSASVAVVGVGGLGGGVVEMLARTGVGRINVIDPDVFTESNLNRQIFCDMNSLGTAKVDAAVKRVAGINPSLAVTPFAVEANAENLPGMIAGCQVVVDALDNVRSRMCLETISKGMGIPFVHGAIAGFLGQVMTVYPQDEGLACIYGDGAEDDPGIERQLGTPGVTPFLIAGLQVAEVIKVLLEWPHTLRNKLLVMDIKKMVRDVIEIT